MATSPKILNPILPGGLLSPLSGADELTDAEETLIANMQAGTGLNETPSGTINSSNVTFTLARTPSPAASLALYLNGVYMSPAGEDYTLTTNSIAYNTAPATGSVHRAHYFIDNDT